MKPDGESAKRPTIFWIKSTVRAVIIGLVAWGIWRTFQNAKGEFANAGFQWTSLRFQWLILAAAFYVVGMFPSCIFWYRVLQAMGQRPTFLETLRAFYIGHLGKYVPGKALVVVIRAALIRGPRVDTTIAAASVFVETLTMMAVGAVVAAVILGTLFRDQVWFLGLAVFLAVCAGLPTVPPLFRRALRVLQVQRANPDIDKAIDGLDAGVMGVGWVTISIGWCFFGLSMWATINSLPPAMASSGLDQLPLLTAAVALAMVAGFLSLLPGGIGVRELVVIPLLSPVFGRVPAILAAVLLRIVWMAAEVLICGVLYLARPSSVPATDSSRHTSEDATGGPKD